MRKWLLLLFLFLVLLIGGVYAFIPNKMVLKPEVQLAVNRKAFTRTILDEEIWRRWWPGQVSSASDRSSYDFSYNGSHYRIAGKYLTSHAIVVSTSEGTVLSKLLFLPAGADSITFRWEATSPTSNQPLNRFRRYRALKSLERDWQIILERLKNFYSSEKNLYDLNVRAELVKDSILISTSIRLDRSPSTDTVYHLIEQLKSYAQKNAATAKGLPMLNVTRILGENQAPYYRVQVALPVDKKLPSDGNISYKWMLGGGNILVAEVQGGPHAVQRAFQQMEVYVEDHNRVAPAIPFQSLVTNRQAEPDSSKWVTKIYWPVM